MKDLWEKAETELCNFTVIFFLYFLFIYSFLLKIESTVHVKLSCSWSVWHDFNWIKNYRSLMYNIFSAFLFFAGTRFDIRNFHSLILTNGVVPMFVLEILINELIEEVKAKPILFWSSFVNGNYIWQIFSLTSIFLYFLLKGHNFTGLWISDEGGAKFLEVWKLPGLAVYLRSWMLLIPCTESKLIHKK